MAGMYKHSRLNEADVNQFKSRIQEILDSERLYLRNDLRLNHISERLGLADYHTSQVISQGFRTSFYRLVRSYRIREAAERLQSPDNKSITEVMIGVGFNSKSSFNQAFKEIIGVTPTEYRERALDKVAS